MKFEKYRDGIEGTKANIPNIFVNQLGSKREYEDKFLLLIRIPIIA